MWNMQEKARIWALARTQYVSEFLWKGKVPDDIHKIAAENASKNKGDVNEEFMQQLYVLHINDYNVKRRTIIDLYASGRRLSIATTLFGIDMDQVLEMIYEFINVSWDNYFQKINEKYIIPSSNITESIIHHREPIVIHR